MYLRRYFPRNTYHLITACVTDLLAHQLIYPLGLIAHLGVDSGYNKRHGGLMRNGESSTRYEDTSVRNCFLGKYRVVLRYIVVITSSSCTNLNVK